MERTRTTEEREHNEQRVQSEGRQGKNIEESKGGTGKLINFQPMKRSSKTELGHLTGKEQSTLAFETHTGLDLINICCNALKQRIHSHAWLCSSHHDHTQGNPLV